MALYDRINKNVCSEKALKKKDWIVIFVFLIAAVLGIGIRFVGSAKEAGIAEVFQDGELIYQLSLEESGTYRITWGAERNVIVIDNGSVFIEEATCPDKLCEKQGKISAVGERIVCLPNRLVVQISGEKADSPDAVVR